MPKDPVPCQRSDSLPEFLREYSVRPKVAPLLGALALVRSKPTLEE